MPSPKAIDAVAEAWASIDGKLDDYRRERDENVGLTDEGCGIMQQPHPKALRQKDSVMNEETYLRELSDLGRRHGVGLTGRTQLYQLEPEDMAFDYSADAEGFVRLGSTGDAEAQPASATRSIPPPCLPHSKIAVNLRMTQTSAG